MAGAKSPGRPPKRLNGAPSNYSPEIGKAICKQVARGTPVTVAARCLGISEDTVLGWSKKGADNPDSRFRRFAINLDKARGIATRRRVRRVEKAAAGGAIVSRTTTTKADGSETTAERYAAPAWQADAFLLERLEPELFGKQRVDGGTNGQAVAVTTQQNPVDRLAMALLIDTARRLMHSTPPIVGQPIPIESTVIDATTAGA